MAVGKAVLHSQGLQVVADLHAPRGGRYTRAIGLRQSQTHRSKERAHLLSTAYRPGRQSAEAFRSVKVDSIEFVGLAGKGFFTLPRHSRIRNAFRTIEWERYHEHR
jgi:hypothetical protein